MTLLELLGLLRKHIKLVILLPVLCALAAGVATYFMADEYTASTSMYVLTTQDSEYYTSTTYSDLSASQLIANDVATLAESDTMANDVASTLGMQSIVGYSVSVESSTDTRIIALSVTGADPDVAASIANAYVQNLSTYAQSVMDVESVNVIDRASVPENPSGPNRTLYVAVAFLAGLFIAICIVVIADMVNVKVRNDDDIDELLGIAVVGHFPRTD